VSCILVVDDESDIRGLVQELLQRSGHDVIGAADGNDGLRRFYADKPDLVILDVQMPGLDGWGVLDRIRELSDVPVIMLTARAEEMDKVRGLRAGADDYVTKPFGMPELLARMRAVRRRAEGDRRPPVIRFGDLEVDLGRQLVKVDGVPIHLTPTEYRLLEAFVTNPGKLLTHGWLLQQAWGPGYSTEHQYLRVFIRQLRSKLSDDPARPRFIVTEAGLGYRWKPDPDEDHPAVS
jgi:two-component system KDP operon response regulator KdpE